MSYSPVDLDYSLDDLIKKRKGSSKNNNSNKNTKPNKSVKINNNNNNNNNRNNNRNNNNINKKNQSRPAIQTNKAKVTKPTSNINSRLSKPVSGPIFTAKNKPSPSIDPSKIVITKKVNTLKKPEVKSTLASKIVRPVVERTNLVESRRPEPEAFTIRGRSNTAEPKRPTSVYQDSGPTTVLVTGLDRGANSEDVKISFEQFGNILHCEVLRDRAGRSFGEAEIEFSTKGAALDCIALMDNRLADGQFLRIILREPKVPPSYVQKQISSVITPAHNTSSRLYSDQVDKRYDYRR